MAHLKCLVRSQRGAHIYVHSFRGIVFFESENHYYETILRCQSPGGHPLYRGTETNDYTGGDLLCCPGGHPL